MVTLVSVPEELDVTRNMQKKKTIMKTISSSRTLILISFIGVIALVLFLQGSSLEAEGSVAADYDAVRDFSITSNPNGVWSYGWQMPLGGSLNLYTVTDTTSVGGISAWLKSGIYAADPPFVAHNDTNHEICFGSFCVPASYLHVHPGPNDEITVVRWTAAADGNFFVQGSLEGLDIVQPTTTLYLLQNSETLFKKAIRNSDTAFFHRTITVSAGDTIDFAVDFGRNNNYFNDSTGIQFKLTASP
jgi:hypothetical protein